MSARVCVVGATPGANDGVLLAGCLRALLEDGWDARLIWMAWMRRDRPPPRDPDLASRIELRPDRDWRPPPGALLRRPASLARYLRLEGEVASFDQPLLRLRPGLIHFDSAPAALAASRVRQILDCRVVVSLHPDGRNLDRPDLGQLWQIADCLIAPDATLRDRLLERGCPTEKMEVLPIPLRGSATNCLDDGTGPIRAISVGALTWEHGFEHAIHAIRLLRDRGLAPRYRIVGDGRDHFRFAVGFARHQLGLAENVELVSANGTSLEDELRNADVFVDPAVRSTAPAAPLAMARALGLPYVATERPGLPEAGGFTVRRRSPTEIAEALAALATDPPLRGRMAAAGCAQLGAYPTVEDHARRLGELYRRVLATPRSTASPRPRPRRAWRARRPRPTAPGSAGSEAASGARSSHRG